MAKFGYLLVLLCFLAACGSTPKQVNTSKSSKKINHAKKSSQKYVPAYGDDLTVDDSIYDSLGHRQGSGVSYSKYIEQNGKFDIPIVQNEAVEKWINYFTGKGRGHYERYLARSGRFVPYMHAVLVKYNLPKDLVYLSMIESGYNTRAMSWAAAGGLWQFIRSTGAIYGLSADYYVDERADPDKATDAAARHLKDLYDEFGDWYLAFAAYNAGSGKVRNAISRHGNDFWDMARGSYLRQETKDYVPKLIAAAIIGKNPRKYGFDNVDYQSPIAFERVVMKSPTDLEVAAECAGVDPDLIRLLNPELLRDMTPPNVTSYQLKIPRGTKDRFMRKYAAMSPAQRMRTTFYTVRSGDTVREIANNYGVSERDLVAANAQSIDVDRDRRSKTERVAVRKGKKTKFVKKQVSYTVVSYDVDPGQVLTIPRNRGVSKGASSRDDAAAHAARSQFGVRYASADEEVVTGKGKKKKDKKKQEKQTQIAKAQLPPLEEPAQAPVSDAPALDAARPAPKSDIDDSLYAGDPHRGRKELVAADTSSDPSNVGNSSGTPMAMNDRPSDLGGAGTPVSPSESELKAAVAGLQGNSDQPAIEGAEGAAPAAVEKSWVPEAQTQAQAEPEAAAPAAPKKAAYHKVKSGETLSSIAKNFGVSVADLKQWNGKKVVPYPRKGTTLLVSAKTSATAKAKAPATTAKKSPAANSYVVRSGDTLTGIATRNGMTVDQLQALNSSKLQNGLQTGTQLSLSPKASVAGAPTKVARKAPAAKAKNSVVKYKVKPGDSLVKIAKRHDTTPQAIQKLNGMKSSKIVPGAVLVVQSR